MKAFIKTHRRNGSTGKDEKEKIVTNGMPMPSTFAKPKDLLIDNENEEAKVSFEFISTNNPCLLANPSCSPNKLFKSSINSSPKTNRAAGTCRVNTEEYSPSKHDNSRTSAPLYSLTLNDVNHSPKKKLFKYPKNLFFKNKDEVDKVINESSSIIGIRGITTHNWDSTTSNSNYTRSQSLALNISSQSLENTSYDASSTLISSEEYSKRDMKNSIVATTASSPKDVIIMGNQRFHEGINTAKETESVSKCCNADNSIVKSTDGQINGNLGPSTNNLDENNVCSIGKPIDSDSETIKQSNEVNGSDESLESKFSFEYDASNQRTGSFRFYKTESSNFVNSKEREFYEEADHYSSDDCVTYEVEEKIELFEITTEKDTDLLSHEESMKSDPTVNAVSEYQRLVQGTNLADDSKCCDDNEVDCSAELLHSLINLTMKNDATHQESARLSQIQEENSIYSTKDFTEYDKYGSKCKWVDEFDENKSVTSEYLNKLNKTSDDLMCIEHTDNINNAPSSAGSNTVLRSNSYPKGHSREAQSNKIEIGGKVITLFRSNSYKDAINKQLENILPKSEILHSNESFLINTNNAFRFKEPKIHEHLSPINENFEL